MTTYQKCFIYLAIAFSLTFNFAAYGEYLEGQPLPNPGYPGVDLKGVPCVGGAQGYGPYDYTNPNHRGHNLHIVEIEHFTREVETLQKGRRVPDPGGDLDYTLRAFPNHHRALYAMMRYQIKHQDAPKNNYPPIECYFQRAIAFKPSDYRVMLLYANYLQKKNQPEMAVTVYQRALSLDGTPVDINYALGLLYFDMKQYDKAVEQAKIVYGAGFKKTKLARQLKSVNRWPIK